MALSITINGVTHTPTTVDGYMSARAAQSIVHVILGRSNGSPDVTLRPALMRSSQLECMFTGTGSETASKAFADALASAFTAQLIATAPDPTSVNMTFVAQGDIGRELEDQTRAAWVVTFDYQEIA